MTDPWARPANQGPPAPPPPQFPQGPPPGTDWGSAAPVPQGEPPKKDASPLVKIKKLFRDPLSIVLVVVIVVALVLAGLLGGELYARSRADSVVAKATECVVQDSASASFGAAAAVPDAAHDRAITRTSTSRPRAIRSATPRA